MAIKDPTLADFSAAQVPDDAVPAQAPLVAPQDNPNPGQPVQDQKPQGNWLDRTADWMQLWQDNDSMGHSLARWAADFGMNEDTNFDITKMPAGQWDSLTAGLPDNVKENIAFAARSQDHLNFLLDDAHRSQQAEEQFATYGGWGTAGRVLYGFADPGQVLLAMGTGGLGVASKGEQVADAYKLVQSARTAQAVLDAAKGSTVARWAAGTALSGAEQAVIQNAIQQGDPTRDGSDVAMAAFQGMLLHGTFSGLFNLREQGQIASLTRDAQNKLKLYQLQDAFQENRNQIVSSLMGGESAARGAEGDLLQRVGSFAASNTGDIDDYPQFRRTLESGGNPNAKAGTSSATGADQFIDSTWLGLVDKYKPAWADGLDRDQLLALRTDASKSAEMANHLDTENAAALTKAGEPVNVYNLYASHHFGPHYGVQFAKAADDVKMEDLLPEAIIKANPYLAGKTKGEVLANWTDRARKGGVDIDSMLNRTGLSDADAFRNLQISGFDHEAALTRLRELGVDESKLPELAFQSGTRLKQGEVRDLERAIDNDQSSLKNNFGTPLGTAQREIEGIQGQIDSILAERPKRLSDAEALDRNVHGDAFSSPKVTRLREKAVDQGIRQDTAPLQRQVKRLQKQYDNLKASTEKTLGDRQARLQMHQGAIAAGKEAKRIRANAGEAQSIRAALGLHEQRTALRDEFKTTASRRGSIDKLDAVDNGIADTESVRTGAKATFGSDTLSSAKALGFSEDLFPNAQGSTHAIPKMKMAGALNLGDKGTFAGVLRGSEHEAVRNNAGRLVGNSLGNVDGTAVEEGASEMATLAAKKHTGAFHAAVEGSYKDWMKENNIGSWQQFRRPVREQFMEEVGRHIRDDGSQSPAVQKMAQRVRTIFADMLKEAKEAGVQGFDSVEVNDHYLPRVFNFFKAHELEQRFGADQLAKLIGKAMQQVNPELDDALAEKLGGHYFQKMREMRLGSDPGILAGMSFDDVGYLRGFLRDAGVEADQLEEVVNKFAQAKSGVTSSEGQGGFRNAKRRTQYDENFAADLRDRLANDGSTARVSVSDLLDSNVETLMGRYTRTMTGHTALAKIGIKSNADWIDRMNAMRSALEHEPNAKNILSKAQAAYDIVSGRPLEDASMWNEIMRTTRDVAFNASMSNAGLANLPDLASLLSWGNVRYTMKNFLNAKALGGEGSMFARGKDGRLENPFYREMEEWMGIGTDYLNNNIFSSYDVTEDQASRVAKGFGAVSHSARVLGRGVTKFSGMGWLSAFGQRAAAQNILLRLKDDLFDRGAFNKARMAALGIDSPMGKRIAQQMKDHTEWAEGELGGNIRRVNWGDWKDLEARDALLYAVNKEARKNIQEEDLGDTFLWQHKNLGKLVMQFRRFGITAYTKQFLRTLNERDAESVTRGALQVALAGFAYSLRGQAKLAGMQAAGVSPMKVQQWEQENMSGSAIGAAALRNAGFMFLLPDIYDSTIGAATGVPVFNNARNTGLSTNVFGGIPAVALVNNLGQAAFGTTQDILRSDRQFKQKDLRAWQALTPFGNHLLIAPLFEAVAQGLPAHDIDTDKNSAQWFWQ